MELVKTYGEIRIYNDRGHYVIEVNGKFECTCDNWSEVEETLKELNREA